jgi:hypothetical protein
VKTPEQKAAQRARAEARKKRRAQETVGVERVSRKITSERHTVVLGMLEKMEGVWLENRDGGEERWRLMVDGKECIVIAKPAKGEVISVRRVDHAN